MNQLILVELDALLDTRLGTLYRLDPSLVEQVLDVDYRGRDSDDWGLLGLDVDQSEYDRLYTSRNEETLKLSRPTAIVPTLTGMTESLGAASLEDPRIEEVGVDVNIWPYRLSGEIQDAIADSVRHWVSPDCKVRIVEYPLKSVTPDLLDQQYVAAIVYNLNDWLVEHSQSLMDTRIPTVNLIAPALYNNGRPEEPILSDGKELDPFAATELAYIEYISLILKDAWYFSLVEV